MRGLVLIKDYDQYTLHHSVNVCLYSLGIGRQLGLGSAELECLGVGGLFHDIGKTRTPAEVVRKPAGLSSHEWSLIWRHPEHGRDILQEMKGLPKLTVQLVYEHHMRYDGGGYPTREADYSPCSLSALITVADVYDAMTTHRPYSAPLPLPEAAQTLLQLRGSHFEPKALDAFLAVVGRVPVGSVVRLATGEVAVVSRLHPTGDVAEVRVVIDPSGGRQSPETCAAREAKPPEVVRPVNPLAHGIDPVEILRSLA
jgi:putative nucleotidyltransferase with HDIG domain